MDFHEELDIFLDDLNREKNSIKLLIDEFNNIDIDQSELSDFQRIEIKPIYSKNIKVTNIRKISTNNKNKLF